MWGCEVRGAAAALVLMLAAGQGHADGHLPGGPPLDAEAFDRLTLGKRMDTYDPQSLYGVEEFLPGRRTIWRDAEGCMRATWQQVGEQICFTYEDRPGDPDCWIYALHEDELWGWFQGQPDGFSVRLVPGNSPMTCDFLGV
jgi:hypothetical protein